MCKQGGSIEKFSHALAKVLERKKFSINSKILPNFLQFHKTINKTISSEPFCSYNLIVLWSKPFLQKLFALIHLITFQT